MHGVHARLHPVSFSRRMSSRSFSLHSQRSSLPCCRERRETPDAWVAKDPDAFTGKMRKLVALLLPKKTVGGSTSACHCLCV